MRNKVELPPERQMIAELMALAPQEEAIRLCLEGLESGTFHHPDGRTDDLGVVRLALGQAALLAHLAKQCPKPLSIEIGFGMGSSAAIILGARRLAGHNFSHLIIDPYGLPDKRGEVVQDYLKARFPKGFQRIKKRSEIGLPLLVERRGPQSAGLIFIDGGHRFESVMTDFVISDLLCCVGGYVVLDDALFPAIETVVNYVTANRPDYAVGHLAVPNCTVLQKISADERDWDSFKPFAVPQREDWTPFEPQAKRQVPAGAA